jgi:hypothetical protein
MPWRYWASGATDPLILNIDARRRGVERYATCLGRFTPRQIAPFTYLMGSLVGHTAGLDILEKIKISVPWRESNYLSSVTQSIIIKQMISTYNSVGIAALAYVYKKLSLGTSTSEIKPSFKTFSGLWREYSLNLWFHSIRQGVQCTVQQ